MSDPLIGFTIGGRYKITEMVGDEMLGAVYSAVIEKSGQPVRVKILRPHQASDPEVFGRFGREMLATALVEHPNTVRMLDFGEHSVFHYLVLESADGRTLKDIIEEDGRFKTKRTAHIAAQIAAALSAAHAENVIHRNLHSENIVLLDGALGDHVKVRDFGLARLQDASGNPDDGGLTEVGTRVGTATYMAPEYIEIAEVDPAGDVYALGVLMYEMITGGPPFEGTVRHVMQEHLYTDPAPPSKKVRGVPGWLDELVREMLRKKPRERPAARDVVDRLEAGVGKSLAAPGLDPDREVKAARAEKVDAMTRSVMAVGSGLAAFAIGVTVLMIIIGIILWAM